MERSRVRPEHVDTLFGFHRDAYQHHVESIWGHWDDAWQRRTFVDECRQSTCEVITDGDELIGYVQYVEEPHQVRLWNLVIRPDHRGRGIGSTIVRELQARAAAHSVPVTLRVFPSNHDAYRLYVRLGFREDSRSDRAIELAWAPV